MSNEPISVKPVTTRAERRAFIDLPKRLYAGDPNWIPPLWRVQEELVGFRKHPFWEFSIGQTFIVSRGNRVIGRVLAVVNHRHNERYEEKRGFFGFFECENDSGATNALLDGAAAWLRSQGMESVRGPVNPSLNYEVGLLIDGFDTPPTFMMTYNPKYYETLLEGWGLKKTQDCYAYDVNTSMLRNVDPKIINVVKQVKERFNVTTRQLNTKRMREDIKSFVDIYNRSLQNTWGYVPMSDAEVNHMADALKLLIVPELSSLAEIDGKPVGVGFALPDFNPIIKKIGGRLFPFGWIRLLMGKRSQKRVRVISTNVVPEWQRWGIGLVIWMRVLPAGLDMGITEAEMSWVLESNHLSRGTVERGGGVLTKTYRIYDKDLV